MFRYLLADPFIIPRLPDLQMGGFWHSNLTVSIYVIAQMDFEFMEKFFHKITLIRNFFLEGIDSTFEMLRAFTLLEIAVILQKVPENSHSPVPSNSGKQVSR
jgi:hypothetical protein